MNQKENSDSSLYDAIMKGMESTNCSLWDITVLLYSSLINDLNTIDVHQSAFIRDYCDKDKERVDEWLISDSYKNFITTLKSPFQGNSNLRPSQKDEIIKQFKNFRTALGEAYNHLMFLSAIYTFLVCVDSQVDDWLTLWDQKEIGRLNANPDLGFSLYLRGTSMLKSAAEICEFATPDVQMNFSVTLKHLIFWPVNTNACGIHVPLPAAPFFKDDTGRLLKESEQGTPMRIAIIPFDCALFDCDGTGRATPPPFLSWKKRSESSGYWEYLPDAQERVTKKVIVLLDAALEQNPHIIIFPEYCIGPGQLKAIRDYITHRKEELRIKNLKFIVAGTTWETSTGENGATEFDNICHVISTCGIWKSYKAAEYCEVESYSYQYGEEDEQKVEFKGFTMVETLSHPAKELVAPYIQNVGYVQLPICRDIINSENIESIASIVAQRLIPAFVLVPAWSRSHDRFVNPLDRIVRIHRSCAILCNCCSAVLGNYVGLVGVPQKKQSPHDISMNKLECSRGACVENCTFESNRCVFLAIITNQASHTKDSIIFSLSRI